jgi:hypothetical protein
VATSALRDGWWRRSSENDVAPTLRLSRLDTLFALALRIGHHAGARHVASTFPLLEPLSLSSSEVALASVREGHTFGVPACGWGWPHAPGPLCTRVECVPAPAFCSTGRW